MKSCLPFILLLFLAQLTYSQQNLSQQSDFIVLKKRNNRTVKTYYPGAFLSAVTWNGFELNGFIKFIRNDSIILVQEEKRLVSTGFGVELDTVYFTIGVNYREIRRWHYAGNYHWGNKRGFVQIVIPKIMMIGGAGYVLLELINTAYRNDRLNGSKKLTALGIGAGIAIAGYVWSRLNDNDNSKASKKYKVVYVKAGEIKLPNK
jgi:hypothetical protein